VKSPPAELGPVLMKAILDGRTSEVIDLTKVNLLC